MKITGIATSAALFMSASSACAESVRDVLSEKDGYRVSGKIHMTETGDVLFIGQRVGAGYNALFGIVGDDGPRMITPVKRMVICPSGPDEILVQGDMDEIIRVDTSRMSFDAPEQAPAVEVFSSCTDKREAIGDHGAGHLSTTLMDVPGYAVNLCEVGCSQPTSHRFGTSPFIFT